MFKCRGGAPVPLGGKAASDSWERPTLNPSVRNLKMDILWSWQLPSGTQGPDSPL